MRYAIELNFDQTTTSLITDLCKVLVDKNLAKAQNKSRPYVPHISLAVTPWLDEEKYKCWIQEYSQKLSSLDLLMVNLGLFRDETNILFIAPRTSIELLELNQEVHKQLVKDNIENWHYYHPDRWVAHCSLTANSSFERITDAFASCSQFSLPFKAKADKIALVDFKEGREICVVDLKNN